MSHLVSRYRLEKRMQPVETTSGGQLALEYATTAAVIFVIITSR
jgi:hypothetical protein